MEKGKNTLLEIARQPQAFEITAEQFESYKQIIDKAFASKPDLVIFLGCGTSYYIAASACSYFVKHCAIPAIFLASYELYLNTESYIKGQKVLLIPFTRCSVTSEVKNTITKAKTYKNVSSLAITCDKDSSFYNDYMLFIPNMDEKSIVMTSTYSTMLYTAMFLSLYISNDDEGIEKLEKLSSKAKKFEKNANEEVEEIGEALKGKCLIVGLGQGVMFGLAGESSIKVKEMVLIPTEAYYTMEYRHGPISIANENTVFTIFVSENTAELDLKLISELKALKSTVIAIGSANKEIEKIADYSFFCKDEEFEYPMLIIPCQYLGAYMAIAKGLDPDMPQNLTKAIIL